MSGCYLPKEVTQSADYQQILQSREEACKADIRDFSEWEWDFLKQDYPGVPLKHLVDNLCRYGQIPHDLDCPTEGHTPFFIGWIGEKNNNKIQTIEPEQCPVFPDVWNQWHE